MSSSAPPDPLVAYRGRLLGLAYRMVDSRADAEDVVQDAYLRFADRCNVRNDEAMLVTIVTRLCLDRLKSGRAQREIYVGPWLPEPVLDADVLSPHAATELADDLSFALLLALERLTPLERAAFLLHDVFDVSFAEVAETLERSEDSVRQLASRARKAVQCARPGTPPSPEAHQRLLAMFAEAVTSGDVSRLVALLREDAIALTDGGGRKPAALNPIIGAEKVARFLVGLRRKYDDWEIRLEPALINGAVGALLYIGDALDQAISFAIDGDRIAAIYAVRNPEKLAWIALD